MDKTIVEFVKTKSSSRYGEISQLDELIGPEGNEGLCHFAYVNDDYVHTAPHIDVFKVEGDNREGGLAKGKDNIVLSGNTVDITTKYFGDDITSLCQYFLENPTRGSKIQYLIWWRDGAQPFFAFVPGLIMSESKEVLGYLHSHVADNNNKVIFEHPYLDGNEYTISGTGFTYTKSSNLFTITLSNESASVSVSNGSESASFNIYKRSYQTTEKNYKVKTANEFGDYIIAAQLTEHNSIGEVLGILSDAELVYINDTLGYVPLPKTFKSLALVSFAESVENISLGIYKVPIALVPNGARTFFMTNITGISTNAIGRN